MNCWPSLLRLGEAPNLQNHRSSESFVIRHPPSAIRNPKSEIRNSLLAMVLDVDSFVDEDDTFGNVRSLIGNALQAAGRDDCLH